MSAADTDEGAETPSSSGIRLQKLLAAAGLGSRRAIEAWIVAGRVTVAGRVARLGERARPDDAIAVDGRLVDSGARAGAARVLLYHKPEGELVTRSDPQGRASVFGRLPKLRASRWVAVGRLDVNTSGLLLFTDSGDLANRLLHPRFGLEREYAVRVLGELTEDARRRLLSGIRLEDGQARFSRLEEMARGRESSANRWFRVVLGEGRKRLVRRLFEAAGVRVSRLIRIRFGTVALPRELRPGRWQELDAAEVRQLGAGEPGSGLPEVPKIC